VLKLVYQKRRYSLNLQGKRLEFNFSKFTDKHLEKYFFSKDIVETLTSVAVASSDTMERYVLNREEPFSDKEEESLEQILSHQPPKLQLHIPPDDLGELPPPKENPSFELKPLPEDMKYAFPNEKKI
jgi:hypothetical protein